jgi:hypothetical protein
MRCLLGACALAISAAVLQAQTGDWPIAAVLSRAASYIDRYGDQLTGLVVEESYVQDVVMVNRFGYRVTPPKGPTHRTLKSDLLLIRPSGTDTWVQFRDVYEVDGRGVRDRNDRLARLFLDSRKSNESQAQKIARESSRYNIGDVERNINLPVLALAILERGAQAGFEFKFPTPEDDIAALPKRPEFTPPAGAVVVSFTETQVRSMITTPQGKNLKAHGRFWITLPGGEVRMSELIVDDFTLIAVVQVAYGTAPNVTVPVPVAMNEMYFNRLNNQRVEGAATYANFRRFDVKTDEAIADPVNDR